ncbi:MAG: hypothetical protein JXQ75_09225 [Phycisphaerae bacterium]|nr:hypothetical protein [Phycisphaerae bacterium]
MSRRKLKTKKEQGRGDPEGATSWPLRLDPAVRSRLLRGLGWATATCVLVIAICAGLGRLENKVHGLAQYDRELALEWVNLPDWLALPDNRHILERLTRQVDLRRDDRLLDPELAERLGRALSAPEVGWVKSVDRVVIRPDGVVAVRCQFRRPAAWVRHGKFCYLVDEDGVCLPGRYGVADCEDSSLMMIEGVAMAPPDVGHVWRGAELSTGLKLVSLLAGRPFRHQVTRVIVENHDGRLDRSRPHIELATDRQGSRVWWGRPPDEEFGTEITAAQKITLLETLYKQWGRIDMNRPYVNIMTWPDRIAMPATQRSPSHGRLLRG